MSSRHEVKNPGSPIKFSAPGLRHGRLEDLKAGMGVQVFTEAEIRASVVFQLSKLVTLLLKAARLNTGAGAWDAIVAGEWAIGITQPSPMLFCHGNKLSEELRAHQNVHKGAYCGSQRAPGTSLSADLADLAGSLTPHTMTRQRCCICKKPVQLHLSFPDSAVGMKRLPIVQVRLEAVERLEAGALPKGSSNPVLLLAWHPSEYKEDGAAGAEKRGSSNTQLQLGVACMAVSFAGEAQGRLEAVDRLEAGALPEGSSDPVVLLVRHASGDEEVGAAGANLKGIILCQCLPHLSHLGECILGLSQLSTNISECHAGSEMVLCKVVVLVQFVRALTQGLVASARAEVLKAPAGTC